MPTQHVEPQSHDGLLDIANALLKARKVVVVTGAGISTNSGIPDFRSENGLYSLVQAQFEAAARQARRVDPVRSDSDIDENRPTKRRRLSCGMSNNPKKETIVQKENTRYDLPQCEHETLSGRTIAGTGESSPSRSLQARKDASFLSTPKPKLAAASNEPATSPLSSPPAGSSILPSSILQTPANRRLIDVALPQSSSPLSSPPPNLFDPFDVPSPVATASSPRSSISQSDVEDAAPVSTLPSSQMSTSAKVALPNMKGKDLFDANIWSDPIRTSVFYTFTTSLRKKIKSAEPTGSHQFIRHLRDRGKLVRCYTQNIDQIEEKVGLSTCLNDGPGSRGRFSRRTTANINQLSKMVNEVADEPSSAPEKQSQSGEPAGSNLSQQLRSESSDSSGTPVTGEDNSNSDTDKAASKPLRRELPRSGVECVFLHGSLEQLRCFLCGRVCSWDDEEREAETLAGLQPECPHCVGATAAREEKGKRALGVGKLRPDIVLYGEEHPNSHLISPIVTHDLGLHPDMLLILGTSLRVHGLKVMVREFAKAVHSKSGKVVFVNFTKPPESSWGDVIDYWVQWDCDAWVGDLQDRIPKMWRDPEPPKPRKKRESSGNSDSVQAEKKQRPPAANPLALRDTKVTGAYWVAKVLKELGRITGKTAIDRRASISAVETTTISPCKEASVQDAPPKSRRKSDKSKSKPPRKSAPGTLERCKPPSSTLNPNHGRSIKEPEEKVAAPSAVVAEQKTTISSILNSVKANPRIRKRKKIDGVEVPAPGVSRRRNRLQAPKSAPLDLKLPPMRSPPAQQSTACPYGRPQPLEPRSPPAGPLASLSPNLRNGHVPNRINNTLHPQEWLVRVLDSKPRWSNSWGLGEDEGPLLRFGSKINEAHAPAAQVSGQDGLDTIVVDSATSEPSGQGILMNWGLNWGIKR